MNIKTLAQTVLAQIVTTQPAAVVSVVANGVTVSAIRDTTDTGVNLADAGELGMTTGTVRCNADAIGAVTQGQEITIAGATAFVMRISTDPVGAIKTIEYTLEKPK